VNRNPKKVIMAISDVIDFIGHVIEGMAVWRYLFSSVYRSTVHERWRDQSRFETGMEIFYFSLGFIFTTLIAGGLGWWAVSAILLPT
jgi:hypothetical protein